MTFQETLERYEELRTAVHAEICKPTEERNMTFIVEVNREIKKIEALLR